MRWIEKYLSKQGVFLRQELLQSEQVKFALANYFLSNNTPPSDIKLFAKKMGNAWRIRKHRENKHLVTLSISLDREVSNHLSNMCRGHTKTEVISCLIRGNYQYYLAAEKAEKEKLAENKRIRKLEQDRAKLDKLLTNSTRQVKQPEQQIDPISPHVDELKNGIAKLYDIIFLANEQGQKIDDVMLLKATKLYYNVFNK